MRSGFTACPARAKPLLELMEWAGIEEQIEEMTLKIHHLQGLDPGVALAYLAPPRHEITVSPSMARKLEGFRVSETLRVNRNFD